MIVSIPAATGLRLTAELPPCPGARVLYRRYRRQPLSAIRRAACAGCAHFRLRIYLGLRGHPHRVKVHRRDFRRSYLQLHHAQYLA